VLVWQAGRPPPADESLVPLTKQLMFRSVLLGNGFVFNSLLKSETGIVWILEAEKQKFFKKM
jgi:hypothetical protein